MSAEGSKGAQRVKAGARTHSVQLETQGRTEFKDITRLLEKLIQESEVENGACLVFVPHTTAGILINENDDPNLQQDLDNFLKRLAPRSEDYQHSDGNCDAHLKSAVIGASKALLIENGRLALGRWQGVFFCEFDGPRRRTLRVKVIPD